MSTRRKTAKQPDASQAAARVDLGRPLVARSVLASALLGEDPPRLPVAHLVRLAAAFGINENRARVALSRMAAQAEVRADAGVYELISPRLLERQQRQRASRSGRTRAWDGSWLIALIAPLPAPAAERSARRVELERARFAEYRDGVWVRPDNLQTPSLQRDDVHIVAARSIDAAHGGAMNGAVGRLWDLGGWTSRAQQLSAELGRTDPTDIAMLAHGFVLSAACLRHFQADPLLPQQLLPQTWPGATLRRSYDQWDRQYRLTLRSLG